MEICENSQHLPKDIMLSALPHVCQNGSVTVNKIIRCTIGCLLEYFQKVSCTARIACLRVTWIPCLCPDGRVNTTYSDPGYAPVLHSCLIYFCWNKRIITLLALIYSLELNIFVCLQNSQYHVVM